MSRRARQRAINPAAHIATMQRARRLSAQDVHMQATVLRTAAREFACGQHCTRHWASLADCANMAETLCAMGLGSGPDAERVIGSAQTTLAEVHQRHAQRGTWTLYADEIDAIQWLVQLHITQLTAASYAEFETALRRTRDRMAQALAGNGSAQVVVVGEIGEAADLARHRANPLTAA